MTVCVCVCVCVCVGDEEILEDEALLESFCDGRQGNVVW